MKKPALPLLFLALALVVGLPLLLTQFGAEEGDLGLDSSLERAPSGEADADHGALPELVSRGESRDVAPKVSGEAPAALQPDRPSDPTAADSHGRSLRGLVVNRTGAPVVGAQVSVKRDWGGGAFALETREDEWILTDSLGMFEAEWMIADKLLVQVKASGYAKLRQTLDFKGEELGTFELEDGVSIRGVVLDAQERPVGDVGVSFQDQSQFKWVIFPGGSRPPDTKTNSDGSFSLDTGAVGPWVLEAQHKMYPTASVSGLSERVGVHPEQVIIRLPLGGSVTGHVEGYSGELDCFVRASVPADFNQAREGIVDSKGRFEVHGLRADTDYYLELQRRVEELGIFGEPLGEPVMARAGEVGVVLVMEGAKGIRFRVVHQDTGAPIESFTAKAGSWWMEPLQGADGKVLTHHEGGRAVFNEVQRDAKEDVRLQVFSEGYETRQVDGIQLPPEGILDLGDIALKPAPMLRVKVVADATSLPVEGARVTLSVPPPPVPPGAELAVKAIYESPRDARIENRSKQTDSEGLASLTTIPGKRTTLKVTHRIFAERVLLPRVYSGGDVEVRLFAGGTVRVRVLTADGAPARRGVRVSHRVSRELDGGDMGYDSKDTSSSGSVAFKNLQAGSHAFRLADEERSGNFIVMEDEGGLLGAAEKEWEMVEVSEGSEAELVLRQAARGVVYGRVTEGGRPLARASLRLDPWSGGDEGSLEERAKRMQTVFFMGGSDVQSQADGSYRMEEAKFGEYELVVSHPLRAMDDHFRVSLSAGEVELNVDLPSTAIEGVVVNQDGDPVEGAEVTVRRVGDPAQGGMAMIMASSGGSEFHVGASGGAGPTRTDGAGRFRVQGLATGCELVLKVGGGSYQTEEVAIDPLRPGDIKSDLRVVLTEGGSVELTLLMSDGREAEFGAIALRELVDGEPGGESRHAGAEDGRALIDGLSPGEWMITATTFDLREIQEGQGPESSEQEQIVTVKAGEVTEVLFQF